MQDSASFWTDIKNFEEQLAEFPDSLCFARLSEVYLKVGLIDDALHTARLGVSKHPRYLSGQRVLSLACHAKGLNEEALAALRLVTEAVPEDISSQKLLGRLAAEAGDRDAACQAFRAALEFAPDDMESRIELESLERSSGAKVSAFEADEDDEAIIEDLEILEDDQSESEFHSTHTLTPTETVSALHHDPLSTVTLAELYVKQGFIQKALDIYRAILADNPTDRIVGERVVELELLKSGLSEPDADSSDTFDDEAGDVSAYSMPAETFAQKTAEEAKPASGFVPDLERQHTTATVPGFGSGPSSVLSQGVADNALVTLDKWLENIRRIKTCR